ncbi:protein AUXIN-REGULATED GENE INVOLVED IN ORGAN SIZE-like [Andrographis paniculata]|uniref:protein AUXIN-REGULATED GENE INVOLVED IN ORGAN SIZE-like n=1 Tax=Andrographis paniculata TaxID=175694 RepID=UPI0021E8E71A|nr:protein AUXIN-REGULATED GENE INVOLVED IN ORGAN SIZE-like [Andrographis paniculata]
MSIAKAPATRLALSKGGFINLKNQYANGGAKDVRIAPNNGLDRRPSSIAQFIESKKLELCKPRGRAIFRYFPVESLCLLVCLTASLLILPLILPPLPPPPSLLLLLPIFILALLMFLAFMPSDSRKATYAYA